MGSVEQDHIASPSDLRAGEARQVSTPKDATTKDAAVEITEDGLPAKTYYSKLSIWLMILYSGLAIGSDG
jgi:hypothetical protein